VSDHEINVAIAEMVGGHLLYCYDLNAMHEVEKVVPNKAHYLIDLESVCRSHEDHIGWSEVHATARQRAEAFLRTKWKGGGE
jgi:hypothetical protein